MNVYSLLADRNGGVDWAGLPLVAGWLGVHNVEGLMHRLSVIKLHRIDKGQA
jgi:hypothetical protein